MKGESVAYLCTLCAVACFIIGVAVGHYGGKAAVQDEAVEQKQLRIGTSVYKCTLIGVTDSTGETHWLDQDTETTTCVVNHQQPQKTLREEIADMANRARELHARAEFLDEERLRLAKDTAAFGVELEAFEERVQGEVE